MPSTIAIDYDKIMQACEKPFAFEDHGAVLHNTKIAAWFIKKAALRRRLYEIDRCYSTTPPELISMTDDVILMRGGLAFAGRTVYAMGAGVIQASKTWDGKTTPLEGFELARSIAKTHKTAASDLLPRLCIEVNIGAYMKDIGKDDIKTAEVFRTWLDKQVQQWEQRYNLHWAANGKGHLFSDLAKFYGLTWDVVKTQLEPGRTLAGLRDISLTDVQAMARLAEIKAQLRPIGGV